MNVCAKHGECQTPKNHRDEQIIFWFISLFPYFGWFGWKITANETIPATVDSISLEREKWNICIILLLDGVYAFSFVFLFFVQLFAVFGVCARVHRKPENHARSAQSQSRNQINGTVKNHHVLINKSAAHTPTTDTDGMACMLRASERDFDGATCAYIFFSE